LQLNASFAEVGCNFFSLGLWQMSDNQVLYPQWLRDGQSFDCAQSQPFDQATRSLWITAEMSYTSFFGVEPDDDHEIPMDDDDEPPCA
jgi:hypothetical protein